MRLRRKVTGMLAAAATAVLALTATAAPAQGSGLRNDYVKASDGALVVVTGYDKTRSSDGVYVYDSTWGSTTQQNQWGAEAVVQAGLITALTRPGTGGNAAIPAGGFTLSGFGTGATWMTTHLAVGQPVTIEKDQILQTSITSTTTATSVNPAPPFEFPGGRGSNQLIAYTDAYSSPTTGTNQYGIEAIASAEGTGFRVTAVGGNNSSIPAGGLVLSGHGTQQTWIQQNVIVGTLLTLDPASRVVTATTDASSYLFQTTQAIDAAHQALTAARAAYADAPLGQAAHTLEVARDQLAAVLRQRSCRTLAV